MDCLPLEKMVSSFPVWEEKTRDSLVLVADANHHAFGTEEDVKLCPTIFMAVCQNVDIQPDIDLLASAEHRQLNLYFTADATDSQEEGYNAFNFRWTPDYTLYVNPPGRYYRK